MRLIERRVGLVFALFLAGLALAATKALWLGTVRASTLRGAAATQQRATITVPARRGAITDRHGEELAVSQPAMSVAATPYLIADPLAVSKRISPLLHRDQAEVLADLSKKHTGFVWLARQLAMEDAKRIQDLHIEGLDFVEESKRSYPRGFVASQLLGFTGTDNIGLSGLEHQHDRDLRGRDGRRLLIKDALGQAIKLDDQRRPRPGHDLQLTIDDRIQEETEQVLAEVGAKFKPAKGATAIVMNPQDGELLAVANWPRVDANRVADVPAWAKQNRAVQTSYEPGSTFKAFTMAGALEDGKVTPDTQFQLPAEIQVADRSIGEAQGETYGTLNAAGILQKSSNVGMIKVGLLLTADRFARWVQAFGFGKPTGVDLPGEQTGIVLARKDYSGSSMGNLPIGQGEAVTPMQMATAYAAIANGGTLRPPRIVRAVGGRRTRVPRGRRVISPQTSATLRDMLEGVLGPGGTASGAAIKGYVLAGKTGTAEKAENGGYSTSKYVASFVGFAPAQDPRLLTLIMVDEPQGDIYGGSVAAPAWRDIMSFALNYLRIPPG
ncbi:MAG: peptidoglycan D,D-transpeptidase FtsI family protein [Solirubrobacteraceae bacterium]